MNFTHNLNTAQNTICEMLADRGLTIKSVSQSEIVACNDRHDNIHVYFCPFQQKITIEQIKEIIGNFEKNDSNHIIIVYDEVFTPCAKKFVTGLTTVDIELFTYDELYYNVTKHIFVPKHELVSDHEVLEQLQKYKNHLPVIYKTDPIARYYKYTRGQIIKITRSDNSIIYRFVL